MDSKFAEINEIIKKDKRLLAQTENSTLLDYIDKWLIGERGYIFRMPPPGDPVAIAWSGGIDSTVVAAYLMEFYGYQIFPYYVVVNRGRSKWERLSQQFWIRYFIDRYGQLFHLPAILYPNDPLFRDKSPRYYYPLMSQMVRIYGIWFADYISRIFAKKVRTIIHSHTENDASRESNASLTSHRIFMLLAMIGGTVSDLSWQSTSLPLELSMGFYLRKATLIKIAALLDLPIYKARSCLKNGLWQCGVCRGCQDRKEAFSEADCPDLTKYLA